MPDHETMRRGLGKRVPGPTIGGRELHAPAVDERQVRAAAGLTMVIGAVAFSYAYFAKQYALLQVVASLFFLEFLIRVTAGIRYSPIGMIARALTLGQPPEWVSAKPKRFAWTLGLGMALAMTIITNSGIRGYLPRTICLICLTLMWSEAALGLCLGCKIYGLLVRRGWIPIDPEIEVCADEACGPSAQASPLSWKATGRVVAGVSSATRSSSGDRGDVVGNGRVQQDSNL
jgi:hypothetical protein